MMFQPVKNKKIYEEIVRQIKYSIRQGQLKSGDKLMSERHLSEQFGVSRASVREALSALEMMGIISIQPGEGSYVRHLPSAESMVDVLAMPIHSEDVNIIDVLEMRKILETETAALAAVRTTDEEVERLKQTLVQMKQEAVAGGHIEDVDAKFHYILVKAARNPMLLHMAESVSHLLTNSYRSQRLNMFSVPGMKELFCEAHEELFHAVAARNPHLAREKMQQHLDCFEEGILWYQLGGEQAVRAFPNIYKTRHPYKKYELF